MLERLLVAMQDENVYDDLRRVIGDISSAVRRAEEPPERHRMRTFVLALAAAAAAGAATHRFAS
jgi:hypothetical protein